MMIKMHPNDKSCQYVKVEQTGEGEVTLCNKMKPSWLDRIFGVTAPVCLLQTVGRCKRYKPKEKTENMRYPIGGTAAH